MPETKVTAVSGTIELSDGSRQKFTIETDGATTFGAPQPTTMAPASTALVGAAAQSMAEALMDDGLLASADDGEGL